MINRLKPKQGNIIVYLILLVGAIACMIVARNKSIHSSDTATMSAPTDTLTVAIQITPTGVALVGDTLGGYNYNLARKLGDNNCRLAIESFAAPSRAIADLDAGRYDIVVCDTTGLNLDVSRYTIVSVGKANDLQWIATDHANQLTRTKLSRLTLE
jgi:hypothetical protein